MLEALLKLPSNKAIGKNGDHLGPHQVASQAQGRGAGELKSFVVSFGGILVMPSTAAQ